MGQAAVWSRREVWTRKLLYPGHTLPTAIAPVAVAIGLAAHDRVFAALPVLLAFLAGWLIQFGGVVTDNYANLIRQPDDREHPELVQAVASGLLSLADLRNTILAELRHRRRARRGALRHRRLAGDRHRARQHPRQLGLFRRSVSVRTARLCRSAVLPVLRHRLGGRRLLRAGGGGARTSAVARGAAAHRDRRQPAGRRADHRHPDHRRHPRLRIRRGQRQEHRGGAVRQNLQPLRIYGADGLRLSRSILVLARSRLQRLGAAAAADLAARRPHRARDLDQGPLHRPGADDPAHGDAHRRLFRLPGRGPRRCAWPDARAKSKTPGREAGRLLLRMDMCAIRRAASPRPWRPTAFPLPPRDCGALSPS